VASPAGAGGFVSTVADSWSTWTGETADAADTGGADGGVSCAGATAAISVGGAFAAGCGSALFGSGGDIGVNAGAAISSSFCVDGDSATGPPTIAPRSTAAAIKSKM
jgi:hypothetical protein